MKSYLNYKDVNLNVIKENVKILDMFSFRNWVASVIIFQGGRIVSYIWFSYVNQIIPLKYDN